jgi:NAD(P)H-quinone oxidoreductase subunit I
LKFNNFGIGIVKGLAVTFKHLFRHPVTSQYPEQRLNTSRRIRGNELVWDNVKCTGCTTCARACPQGAIIINTSVDSTKNRYDVIKIEVDSGYCIQCGLCVESCPYEALYLGRSFERAKYRRQELVQANEQLLASDERPISGFLNPEVEKRLPRQTLLVEKIVEKE